MEQDFSPPPLSVYVHIPFCLSKCGYCSFFSVPYSKSAVVNYVHHLVSEKNLYRTYLKQALGTLYFGGGTPSLLSPQQINSICEGLLFAKNAEITLEINPLQISESYLEGLKTTKVNRLSLGLQSMDDTELKWLERRHQAREIKSKIKLLQEFGYSNFSLDLMYGVAGQHHSKR